MSVQYSTLLSIVIHTAQLQEFPEYSPIDFRQLLNSNI